ncbi:vitamin D3 receptor-like [Dreissena polymorpha]|uniref:vitamin D3 receptor-like n=1 Tax=Dreissena polymorpha TaxID=45954 RepID=UPI00226410D9|nr:vitamin D3 receptor-like [Dreissena polymorpha]
MLKRQNSVFLRYQNKKFSLRTVAQTCPPPNALINGEITRGESPVSDAGVSTNNTQSSGQGHGLNSAEEPFGDDGRPLTDVSFLRNKPKLLANIPNQNGHQLNGEYVIKPNLVNGHTLKSVEETKATVMTQVLTSIQLGVRGMLSFAMDVPGFQELDSEDQASLLKASRFDIWYVGHIRCFNCTLMVGACEWEFHAEELAQVWGADLVEMIFRMSRQGNLLDFSTEEIAVLRAVCLTFTDRCPTLKERQRVEQIHSFLWDVLKYVVSRRLKDFNHWLSKTVNFLCLLREFGIKFESASSQLTLDWEVLSNNPLLLSAFLS